MVLFWNETFPLTRIIDVNYACRRDKHLLVHKSQDLRLTHLITGSVVVFVRDKQTTIIQIMFIQ